MIKKIITFSLLLLFLTLLLEFGINYFKTSHHVEYDISGYMVEEDYIKKSGKDYYLIKASKDGKEYIFNAQNEFNKNEKIIKEIIPYDTDDISCATIIYTNNSSSTPLCYKDKILHSYISVENEPGMSEYLKQLNKYAEDKITSSDESYVFAYNEIYKNNLYKNEDIIMYNYKNIIKINGERTMTFDFSNKDVFKNEYGTLVGKYYVIPKMRNNIEFSHYLIVDLEKETVEEIDLAKEVSAKISSKMYVNGIYNSNLYIFDKSNLVQYEINPDKGEIKVVGNKDKKGIVYKNGQEEEIGVYTLNNEKVKFTENYDAYKEIDYDQIFLTSNGAVYVKDGVFYKVYNNYLKNPIYLFEAKNVQDIKVKEDNIYYINDQFLYRYNDYGNVRILKREQFKYDYTNIYDVYFEE